MTPIPRVSSKHYDRPARVRVRVKGSGTEGAVYEGQRLIQPCRNCPKTSLKTPT